VWIAHVPPAAEDFRINATGDLASEAITRRGSTVGLFVPLSPGLRQLAFNYELPSESFPLSLPVEHPTGVLEVMLQEPTARVLAGGAAMRQMAPVSAEGRIFRRFLAQDLEANSVVTIDIPRLIGAERQRVYVGVGISILIAMLLALVFASRRSLPRLARKSRIAPPSPSRALVRSIATLDEEHERTAAMDDAARAAYEFKRAALKAQLTDVLAAEKRS
jgi:hypothetical protein